MFLLLFRIMKIFELVEIVKDVGISNNNLQEILENKIREVLDLEITEEVSEKIRRFIRTFKKKLEKYHRNYEKLLNSESIWLNFIFLSPIEKIQDSPDTTNFGRPNKDWDDMSNRTR